jgi:peptidoglycan/xylan/chitin deacetylase (PgdA/CDA1 family)
LSVLALTFDDGPDPVWTPRLLDLLGELGTRATFFVIAPRAAAHPELIARMLDEGHSLGLHCEQHVRHSSREIAWGREDAARATARLRELGGSPGLWRTPWGDLAWWSQQVATEQNLRLVHWTVDTHDWRGDSTEQMFADTCDRLTHGAIVLAHDGIGPGARRTDAEQTLGFVELAVAHARRHRLGLVALR